MMEKKKNVKREEKEAKWLADMEHLTATCKSYRHDLRKQERTHAEDVKKLTIENESLQLEMCRIQDKLDHWKSTCQRQQNENVVIAKSKLVTKENEALKEDLVVLKTVIQRLNKELAFYQAQLRKEYQSSPHKIPQFSYADSNIDSDDVSKGDDLKGASATILPLLTAYDEAIDEKNGVIQGHERLMEQFKTKLLNITEENNQLHKLIAECNAKGTVSNEEWTTLYDNAVVVLQENDLLHEKIEILNRKIAAMESANDERVEKLKKKIGSLEEDKSNLKSGLTEMQNQSASLTAQITKLGIAIQERIPKDKHEASVNECKREFDQLRSNYAQERKTLSEKLNEATLENDRLNKEITAANSEITKLQDSIKNLEKSNLEYAGSLVVLKKELSISVKALQLNESSVKEMMKVAECIQNEKEALERSFNNQRESTAKIMAVRNQEVMLMKDFEEKMRSIDGDYEKKLQSHISRAKKLEDYLETIAERHQADLSQLHELIKEKTVHIEKLTNEKRQLAEDLETVWRATSKEQQNVILSRTPAPAPVKYGTMAKKSSPGELDHHLQEESSTRPRRGSGDNKT